MIRAKFKSNCRKYFLTTALVKAMDSVIVTFYLFPKTYLVSDSCFSTAPTCDKFLSFFCCCCFFKHQTLSQKSAPQLTQKNLDTCKCSCCKKTFPSHGHSDLTFILLLIGSGMDLFYPVLLFFVKFWDEAAK